MDAYVNDLFHETPVYNQDDNENDGPFSSYDYEDDNQEDDDNDDDDDEMPSPTAVAETPTKTFTTKRRQNYNKKQPLHRQQKKEIAMVTPKGEGEEKMSTTAEMIVDIHSRMELLRNNATGLNMTMLNDSLVWEEELPMKEYEVEEDDDNDNNSDDNEQLLDYEVPVEEDGDGDYEYHENKSVSVDYTYETISDSEGIIYDDSSAPSSAPGREEILSAISEPPLSSPEAAVVTSSSPRLISVMQLLQRQETNDNTENEEEEEEEEQRDAPSSSSSSPPLSSTEVYEWEYLADYSRRDRTGPSAIQTSRRYSLPAANATFRRTSLATTVSAPPPPLMEIATKPLWKRRLANYRLQPRKTRTAKPLFANTTTTTQDSEAKMTAAKEHHTLGQEMKSMMHDLDYQILKLKAKQRKLRRVMDAMTES